PGMDGVELFQRLRRTAPDAHYLLMTAFTEAGRLRDARRAGIEGILPTPVPVEALLGFVDAADRGANGMLIVEDEEGLATNLEELFAGQWEVRRARSLAEALDVCDRQPLAAALVDLRLPDGSGEELVQQLLARGTRVVVITGMPREDAEALVGGMVPLVTKPFDAPDLIERLRATA
ncbi:MAG: response regulator, partial [Myxococcota bacterium]